MVRAKFNLTSLIYQNQDDHSQGADLTFTACTEGEINEQWAEATPAGSLTMFVANPQALDQFKSWVFEDFYLDISPVALSLPPRDVLRPRERCVDGWAMSRDDYQTLASEISGILNYHGVDSSLRTPDFVLAEYLTDCLAAYAEAVQRARASEFPPAVAEAKSPESDDRPVGPTE